ncbi:hypothetical protein C8F01DRAFT_1156315 [Mycena amicta]|nr:hypothetical protein C8F01DRAFT_1156315 [Mycena amicta]
MFPMFTSCLSLATNVLACLITRPGRIKRGAARPIVPTNSGFLISMDEFLFRTPVSLNFDEYDVTTLKSNTQTRWARAEKNGPVAKLFVFGKVVAKLTNPCTGVEHLLLRAPDIVALVPSFVSFARFVQSVVDASTPKNKQVLDFELCASLGDKPEDTVLRLRLDRIVEPTQLECNNMPGLGFGSKYSPCYSPGSHLRCAVNLVREDSVLMVEAGTGSSWRSSWVLHVRDACRFYYGDAYKDLSRSRGEKRKYPFTARYSTSLENGEDDGDCDELDGSGSSSSE